MMKKFEMKGSYKEKKSWKKFTRTVEAVSEKRARELLQSLLGSEHQVVKHHLKIDSLQEAQEKTGE
ncbi:MAG: 50S ribosomal protein L18Ae [Candidatus Diapherotrites archaeon]|nr:50S ribosomal protein L18Ae [Candidatus Diapherotrites archaeon]